MNDFLNSQLFSTIILLVTGLFIFIIYSLQKFGEKVDAAIIIINEIRNAELAIVNIKNTKKIAELSIILPNNSWAIKKHLFVKNLDLDEYNLINDFYNKCNMAEGYRVLYFKTLNESVIAKSNEMQVALIRLMEKTIANNKEVHEYEANKEKLVKMANAENWLFEPNRPVTNLIEYINNINLVTTSSAGLKIKKIGRVK